MESLAGTAAAKATTASAPAPPTAVFAKPTVTAPRTSSTHAVGDLTAFAPCHDALDGEACELLGDLLDAGEVDLGAPGQGAVVEADDRHVARYVDAVLGEHAHRRGGDVVVERDQRGR